MSPQEFVAWLNGYMSHNPGILRSVEQEIKDKAETIIFEDKTHNKELLQILRELQHSDLRVRSPRIMGPL